jgi:thiopeptide-type bacteriocin biosynthesis protein
MINDVLEHFEISLENRISFVKSMEQAYKKEHDIEKENNQKLNQLYRIYKDEIKLFLQEKQEPVYLEGLSKLFKTTKKEIAIIKEILNTKSSISLENLISSIIHMNINRIFRSKQRQYEMLCYDFMTRYYKSIAARR